MDICLVKISISFSLSHDTSIQYIIANFTLHLQTVPLYFRGDLLPHSNLPHSIDKQSTPFLAVTAASHPPFAFNKDLLSPRYVDSVSTLVHSFYSYSTVYNIP